MLGAWCLVLGAWCLVRGAGCLVRGAGLSLSTPRSSTKHEAQRTKHNFFNEARSTFVFNKALLFLHRVHEGFFDLVEQHYSSGQDESGLEGRNAQGTPGDLTSKIHGSETLYDG